MQQNQLFPIVKPVVKPIRQLMLNRIKQNTIKIMETALL